MRPRSRVCRIWTLYTISMWAIGSTLQLYKKVAESFVSIICVLHLFSHEKALQYPSLLFKELQVSQYLPPALKRVFNLHQFLQKFTHLQIIKQFFLKMHVFAKISFKVQICSLTCRFMHQHYREVTAWITVWDLESLYSTLLQNLWWVLPETMNPRGWKCRQIRHCKQKIRGLHHSGTQNFQEPLVFKVCNLIHEDFITPWSLNVALMWSLYYYVRCPWHCIIRNDWSKHIAPGLWPFLSNCNGLHG